VWEFQEPCAAQCAAAAKASARGPLHDSALLGASCTGCFYRAEDTACPAVPRLMSEARFVYSTSANILSRVKTCIMRASKRQRHNVAATDPEPLYSCNAERMNHGVEQRTSERTTRRKRACVPNVTTPCCQSGYVSWRGVAAAPAPAELAHVAAVRLANSELYA
jgi:hypothetical protein